MPTPHSRVWFFAAVAWCAAASSSFAQRYVVSETPGLAVGHSSRPVAINEAGLAVGDSDVAMEGGVLGYDHQAVLIEAGKPLRNLGSLGGLSGPARNSIARGINDSNVVVGDSQVLVPVAGSSSGSIRKHAFSWTNGVLTDLGTLPGSGAQESSAYDINRRGQIVGVSEPYGFLREPDGSWVRIERAGGKCAPYAINDAGDVVGRWTDFRDATNGHAFVYRAGTVELLSELPGSVASSAWDNNNAGAIVGYCISADRVFHAVMWRNNQITDLGNLPGAAFGSYARGINDRGQIVGHCQRLQDASDNVAFLWENGSMLGLNDLIAPNSGWVLQRAVAINEQGVIVGNGLSQRIAGFVLRPRVNLQGAPVPSVAPAPRIPGGTPKPPSPPSTP